MSPPRDILADRFGFGDFLPGQEAVIEHLLAGRSAAAVFPTGGGKSLCYQLPALLLPGVTVVVSPLIALMKDQIDQLRHRGIAASRIDSTLSAEEYREVMGQLRGGALKLIYAAPERFNNERFRGALAGLEISLFAVDEAHCISEWGHNFRPDYLKLASFAERCRAAAVLALTATATPKVLEDIRSGFRIAPEHAVRTGFYRPNLELRLTPVAAAERDGVLLERLRRQEPGPTIVYVTLQRTAESVAERLLEAGFEARPYHAGMKDEVRAQVQEWFLASRRAVVVATIAFGMGIDKADIRAVLHYNLSKSLENLAQEIGRAGRDGLPARCESLVCPADLAALRNFAYGDTPARGDVEALLAELAAEGEELALSFYDLAARHDIRPLVLRTLLTYLELEGYLAPGTPFYDRYEFKPLYTSGEILGRFEGSHRQLLTALFRASRKGRVWFKVDPGAVARQLGESRARAVTALEELGEQGLLVVRSAGLRHPYRWLRRPPEPAELAELAQRLHRRALAMEAREIGRLEEVLALAVADECQTAALCRHFGDDFAGPCSHCSHCLDGRAELPPSPPVAVDEEVWRQAEELRGEVAELRGARAFARFLAGLGSPRLSRRKLTSHRLFGALASVPFPHLLERAELAEPAG